MTPKFPHAAAFQTMPTGVSGASSQRISAPPRSAGNTSLVYFLKGSCVKLHTADLSQAGFQNKTTCIILDHISLLRTDKRRNHLSKYLLGHVVSKKNY